MKLITVNLSYYNQSKDMVLKHLSYWKQFSSEVLEKMTFFIIDDGSKVPISDILSNDDIKGIDVRIFRIDKDIKYNIGGMRNLGAKCCNTPYYFILDMDTLINKDCVENLLKLASANINKNKVFKFNRKVLNNNKHPKNNKTHPAVCLIRLDDYWKIGGCDEDFVGNYGQTDPHFWYRSKNIVTIEEKRDIYLEYDDDGECDIDRSTHVNAKLFQQKIKTNNWSNDFIRFSWREIHL